MPFFIADLDDRPFPDAGQGERHAALRLTRGDPSRGQVGFRVRAMAAETGRTLGGWAGDCARTVTEVAMSWCTSYQWQVVEAEGSMDLSQALDIKALAPRPVDVPAACTALLSNWPRSAAAPGGGRVVLPRRPAPVEDEAEIEATPTRVGTAIARRPAAPAARRAQARPEVDVQSLFDLVTDRLAEGRDPARVLASLGKRLGIDVQGPLGQGADPVEVIAYLASQLGAEWVPPGNEEEEGEAEGELDGDEEADELEAGEDEGEEVDGAEEEVEPAPPARRPRPLRPGEVPAELTEEQGRFLQRAGDPGAEAKMRRTHERAMATRAHADAVAARNRQIEASVERGRKRQAAEAPVAEPEVPAPPRGGKNGAPVEAAVLQPARTARKPSARKRKETPAAEA